MSEKNMKHESYRRVTDSIKAEMQSRVDSGKSFRDVASSMGFPQHVVHYHTDSVYRAHTNRLRRPLGDTKEFYAPEPQPPRDDYSDPGSAGYTRPALPEREVRGLQNAIHAELTARGLLKPGDEIAHTKRGKQAAADVYAVWTRAGKGRVWVDEAVLTDKNLIAFAAHLRVELIVLPAMEVAA